MAIQPKYHWQFTERESNVVTDSSHGLKGQFHRTSWKGHGRIGQAIQLDAKDSHITFDDVLGKFGTNDFTVAFGIKILNIHGQNQIDLIGSRNIDGHGNWFALFLQNQGKVLAFAVDEDRKGKHFTEAKTKALSSLPNKKWHHIAIVREGKTLKIYLDSAIVATKTSKTGIAKINGNAAVKLGHYTEHTATAQYEDLRFYDSALKEEEIQALIPPYNPPLQAGEIELVGTDDATVILKQDVADLSHLSTSFKKLRVGKNTGVTLYQQKDFKGIAQRCYADLPDIQLSLLESFPGAIRIWSAVGEPFTGTWVIKAPNGQFLSLSQSFLSTAPQRSFRELVRFHYNLHQRQLQLLPGSPQEGAALKVSPAAEATPLFVEELENRTDEFLITNQTKSQWLELGEDNTFNWTVHKENRAVFVRVAKRAANENEVGELATGEVALYKHRAYYGAVWILSDSEKDQSGSYKHLADFEDLNDETSSIRLGPNTGVTLFRHFDHQAAADKREEEIEDIVENVHRLSSRQIGQDNLSSIKIFRTISPEDIFASYSTKLSQDYRMVGDNLEEFSAYRTILRLEPGAGEIEVSATDLTKIEVEETTYEIDERRSVTLKPNELNLVMITSEADGLNTPGLKIRTSEMASNEQVVIFPNKDVQQQISELEEGALWNATDSQGNLIVDRNAHSKEEVASVQNTIKRMMGTVTYADSAPSDRSSVSEPSTAKSSVVSSRAVSSRAVSSRDRNVLLTEDRSRVQISNRVVSGATIDKPWKLELKSDNNNKQQFARAVNQGQLSASRSEKSPATSIIQEVEVSQNEFTRLLNQAIPEETTPAQPPVSDLPGQVSFLRIGNPFKKAKDAVKKATSVVIGVVDDVVNVIVDTAEGIFKFVIDTAEKVVEFVEAVVEKVVKSIKLFIEFLQFLFNWGDILDTQRYLTKAINSGLNFATELTEAAKQPISDFVDDMQGAVEDGINSLTQSLGSEPSKVRTGELPEAAQWLLSKLMGGAKQKESTTTPKLAKSQDSALEKFFSRVTEEGEDIIGMLIRSFEGLGESILTLIQNPGQPQFALIAILEALRDVIIQFLDFVENIVFGFLEIVGDAIEKFQNLIKGEINIPFISRLFELIGAGKLTLLNVSTLLLAIPVTVFSKAIFKEKPFQGALPPDFSKPAEAKLTAVSLRASLEAKPPENDEQPDNENKTDEPDHSSLASAIRGWGIVSLATDLLNGYITAGLDAIPEELDELLGPVTAPFEVMTLVLDGFSWFASFPASPNFPGGHPYNVAAHGVSKTNDESEYWERVMWGWRTAVFGFDIGYFGLQFTSLNPSFNRQRMKRGDRFSNGLIWGFTLVDLGLTGRYLAATAKEGGAGLEIANEVVAWLPAFGGILRQIPLPHGLVACLALAAIDISSARANTVMGSVLLAGDLADL